MQIFILIQPLLCLLSLIQAQSCSPGQYYDEISSSCQPCDSTCATCVQYAKACTSCVGSLQLKSITASYQICTCQSGMVMKGGVCQSSCDFTCETCDSTNCLSCGPTRSLVSGQCNCQAGYYEYGLKRCINNTRSCKDIQLNTLYQLVIANTVTNGDQSFSKLDQFTISSTAGFTIQVQDVTNSFVFDLNNSTSTNAEYINQLISNRSMLTILKTNQMNTQYRVVLSNTKGVLKQCSWSTTVFNEFKAYYCQNQLTSTKMIISVRIFYPLIRELSVVCSELDDSVTNNRFLDCASTMSRYILIWSFSIDQSSFLTDLDQYATLLFQQFLLARRQCCSPSVDNVRVTLEEDAISIVTTLPINTMPTLPYKLDKGCILPQFIGSGSGVFHNFVNFSCVGDATELGRIRVPSAQNLNYQFIQQGLYIQVFDGYSVQTESKYTLAMLNLFQVFQSWVNDDIGYIAYYHQSINQALTSPNRYDASTNQLIVVPVGDQAIINDLVAPQFVARKVTTTGRVYVLSFIGLYQYQYNTTNIQSVLDNFVKLLTVATFPCCQGPQIARIPSLALSDPRSMTIVPNVWNFTMSDFVLEVTTELGYNYGFFGPKPSMIFRSSSYFGVNSKVFFSGVDDSFLFMAVSQHSNNNMIQFRLPLIATSGYAISVPQIYNFTDPVDFKFYSIVIFEQIQDSFYQHQQVSVLDIDVKYESLRCQAIPNYINCTIQNISQATQIYTYFVKQQQFATNVYVYAAKIILSRFFTKLKYSSQASCNSRCASMDWQMNCVSCESGRSGSNCFTFDSPQPWGFDVSYDYQMHAQQNQRQDISGGSTVANPRYQIQTTDPLYIFLQNNPAQAQAGVYSIIAGDPRLNDGGVSNFNGFYDNLTNTSLFFTGSSNYQILGIGAQGTRLIIGNNLVYILEVSQIPYLIYQDNMTSLNVLTNASLSQMKIYDFYDFAFQERIIVQYYFRDTIYPSLYHYFYIPNFSPANTMQTGSINQRVLYTGYVQYIVNVNHYFIAGVGAQDTLAFAQSLRASIQQQLSANPALEVCNLLNSLPDQGCSPRPPIPSPTCAPKCLTCYSSTEVLFDPVSNQPSTCITCDPNQFRTRVLASGSLWFYDCICMPGYFDNGVDINCQNCHPSLSVCTSYRVGTCRNLTIYYFDSSAQRCLCNAGYFLNSTLDDCQVCSPACGTCSILSYNCTSCATNFTFDPPTQTCLCPPGGYNMNGQCLPCYAQCGECRNSPSTCYSCKNESLRTYNSLDHTCNCTDGYYGDANMSVCAVCYAQCQTCDNPYSCKTCKTSTNRFFNSSSITCECNPGYYNNPNDTINCYACNETCLTCMDAVDGTKCSSCNASNFRSLKGSTCYCIPGYYEVGQAACSICDYTCAQCIDIATNCIYCEPAYYRSQSGSTCICGDGYYDDKSHSMCQACVFPCKHCTDPVTCTACPSKRVLSGTTCDCQDHLFSDPAQNQICAACDYSCFTCKTTSTNCLSCNSDAYRTLTGNKCLCNDGYFEIVDASSELCGTCQYSCLKCEYFYDNCTTCNDSNLRYFSNYQCVCQDGYFDDTKNTPLCQKCANQCYTCATHQDGTKCLSCHPGTNLCYTNITYDCICCDGYYSTGPYQCAVCMSDCRTCSQAQKCLSCDSSKMRYYDPSSNSCPCQAGYYDITTACTPICPPECATCDTDNFCLTCPNGRTLVNKRCVCSSGLESGTSICRRCQDSIIIKSLDTFALEIPNYLSSLNSILTVQSSGVDPLKNTYMKTTQGQFMQLTTDVSTRQAVPLKYTQGIIVKDFLPFGADAYYGTQISNGISHWAIETAAIDIQLSISNAPSVACINQDDSYQQQTWNQIYYVQTLTTQCGNQGFLWFLIVPDVSTLSLVQTSDSPTIIRTFQITSQVRRLYLFGFAYQSSSVSSQQIQDISAIFMQILFKTNQNGNYLCIIQACSPEIQRFRSLLRDRHQELLDAIGIPLTPFSTQNNIISQSNSSGLLSGDGIIPKINGNMVTSGQYDNSQVNQIDSNSWMFTLQFPEIYLSYISAKAGYVSTYQVEYNSLPTSTASKSQINYVTKYGAYNTFILDISDAFKTLILIKANPSNSDTLISSTNNYKYQITTGNQEGILTLVFSGQATVNYTSLTQALVRFWEYTIELCSSSTPSLDYLSRYAMENTLTQIQGRNIKLVANNTSPKMVSGSGYYGSTSLFTDSHKISLDQVGLPYTDGYIQQTSAYGLYYTAISQGTFVLGLLLDKNSRIDVTILNNGDTPVVNQYTFYQSEITVFKAFVTVTTYGNFSIAQMFILNDQTCQGIQQSYIVNGQEVQITLIGLDQADFVYYVMAATYSDPISQGTVQDFFNNIVMNDIRPSRSFYNCKLRCSQINTVDLTCQTTSPLRLEASNAGLPNSLIDYAYNVKGGFCYYLRVNKFTPNGASINQTTSGIVVRRIQPKPQGTYIQFNGFNTSIITSSILSDPSPFINSAGVYQSSSYFRRESQLFSQQYDGIYLIQFTVDKVDVQFQTNFTKIALYQTYRDYIQIYNKQFERFCITFFSNAPFPNLYECFIMQTSPQQISFKINPNNIQYTLQEETFVTYFVIAETYGNRLSNSGLVALLNMITGQIQNQFFDVKDCWCLGRHRDPVENCVCSEGYYYDPNAFAGMAVFLQDCLPCNFTCQLCTGDGQKCIACDIKMHRVMNSLQSTCECIPGYLETGVKLCQACDPQCGTCSKQTNNCTSCLPDRTLQMNKCICKDGYYDTGVQRCQQCDSLCQTCVNTAMNCMSCRQGFVQTGNTCICGSGSIDAVGMCQGCAPQCLTCDATQSSCKSCNTTNTFRSTLVGQTCPCLQGYYDNTSSVCAQCDLSCATCSIKATNCTSCRIGSSLMNNICQCSQGYYNSGASCLQCDSSCFTCAIQATNCLTCPSNRIYDDISKKCTCANGYYQSGSNCLSCPGKCFSCSDGNTCISCAKKSNRVLETNCKCQTGFAEQPGQIVCQPCNSACLSCASNNSNYCTSCLTSGTNRVDQSAIGQCPCNPGYFDDGYQISCIQCSTSCVECSGYDICTKCAGPPKLRISITPTNTGECQCQKGYYDDYENPTCQKCPIQCIECSSLYNCSVCNLDQTNRYSANFQCPCKSKYYDDGTAVCKPCLIQCQECDNSTSCRSCADQTRNATNACSCRDGYREYPTKQLDCQQCPQGCLRCTATDCLVCMGDRSVSALNKQCVCPNGFYENGGYYCTKCPNQCLTCEKNKCLSCRGNRINEPLCTCPEGQYDNGIDLNCNPCSQYCKICVMNTCQVCVANRVVVQGNCVCDSYQIPSYNSPYCSDCNVAVANVTFRQDLDSLMVKFPYGVQLNPDRIFVTSTACAQIFVEIKSFGQNPNCYISLEDNSELIIQLGNAASINQDDEIAIQLQTLQAINCQHTILQFILTHVFLSDTDNPIAYLPEYKHPVTLCLDTTIQLYNTLHTGMRNFVSVVWRLLKAYPMDIQVLQKLQTIVDNSQNSPQLVIPKLTLSPYGNYTFQATYTNFIGKSGIATTKILTYNYESPVVSIDMGQLTFYRYESIQLIANVQHINCQTGVISQLFDSIQVTWSEDARMPLEHKPILPQPIVIYSDGQTTNFDQIVNPYVADVFTQYSISITAQLTNKPLFASQSVKITVLSAPLQAYIFGGSRIQAFGTPTQLLAFAKDPDLPLDFNKDSELNSSWTCIDFIRNVSCVDQVGQPLPINYTDYEQSYVAKQLAAYTTYNFGFKVSKDTRQITVSALIIVVETDLPALVTSIPAGYLQRGVLISEQLPITVVPQADQNPDYLTYAAAIIYQFDQVAIMSFTYLQFNIRIWDYFSALIPGVGDLTIRITCKDPRFQMPSISSISLKVVVPPHNCVVNVNPTSGYALTTLFQITVTGCKDTVQPINYQLSFYRDISILLSDIISSINVNKITLNDPQPSNQFITVLPAAEQLILLVGAQNALGAVANLTSQVRVKTQNVASMLRTLYSLAPYDYNSLSSFFIIACNLPDMLSSPDNIQDVPKIKAAINYLYPILEYFRDRVSSKTLYENVLKATYLLQRTGVMYVSVRRILQQDPFNIINFGKLRTDLLKLTEQLGIQTSQLIQLLNQKSVSNGGLSRYDAIISSLDNIFLNSGYIIDALFQVIQSDFYGQNSDYISSIKKQIRDTQIIIQKAQQLRLVPNQNPAVYEGIALSSSVYQLSPQKMTDLLVPDEIPNIFMTNNDKPIQNLIPNYTSPNLSQPETDEIDYNQYFQTHPSAAKEVGYNGTRRALEVIQSINVSQYTYYQLTVSKFNKNPYVQDQSFQKYKAKNATLKYNQSYQVITPHILKNSNGTLLPVTQLSNNNKIQMRFSTPSFPPNMTPVCVSQQNEDWGTGACDMEKTYDSINNYWVISCDCRLIDATTIMNNIESTIVAANISGLLSPDAFKNFISSPFYKYAIFYEIASLSIIFAILMMVGMKLDNIDFMENIVKQLKDIPRALPEMRQLKKDFPEELEVIFSNDEISDYVLSHPQDYFTHLDSLNVDERFKLAKHSLETQHVRLEKENKQQGVQIMDQIDYLDDHLETIQDRQTHRVVINRRNLPQKRALQSITHHQLISKRKEMLRKRSKIPQVVKLMNQTDDTVGRSQIRFKKITLSDVKEVILLLHELLQIIKVYDEKFSRPTRLMISYSKTLMILSLQSLVIKVSIVMTVLLGMFFGQVINLVLKVIKVCMMARYYLKLAGILLTIGVICFSWFVIMAKVGQLTSSQANIWALQFLVSYSLDQILMEAITICITVLIFPWVFVESHKDDGAPLAHLLYFFIRSDAIEQYFLDKLAITIEEHKTMYSQSQTQNLTQQSQSYSQQTSQQTIQMSQFHSQKQLEIKAAIEFQQIRTEQDQG